MTKSLKKPQMNNGKKNKGRKKLRRSKKILNYKRNRRKTKQSLTGGKKNLKNLSRIRFKSMGKQRQTDGV